MNIQARFTCTNVLDLITLDDKYAEQIMLRAVYSSDPDSPNYAWSQATPDGDMRMTISNPKAWGAFEQGKEYDVMLSPVEPT